MKKISFNGKEYNSFDDLPEDAKKFFPDANKNGMPDMIEDVLEGKMPQSSSNIYYQGKNYGSIQELPPQARAKIKAAMDKYGNNPMMNKIMSTNQADPGYGQVRMSGGGGVGGGVGGKTVVFGIIIFICGIGGLIWGIFQLVQASEETFELTTDPTHFDPVASYEEVKGHVDPNAKLLSFDAQYVRPDGTMDLNADYKPSTDYDFYVELAEAPKDAPPIGAGSNLDGKWYQKIEAEVYRPGQWRNVMKTGGGVSTSYSYANKGIDLDRDDPTGTSPGNPAPEPKCSLKDLWDIAIEKGAPKNAVAMIDYDDEGYDFNISGANIYLTFTTDCKLEEE